MPLGLEIPGSDTKSLVQQIMGQAEKSNASAEASTAELAASREREAAARAEQVKAQAPTREKLKQAVSSSPAAPEFKSVPEAPTAPQINTQEMSETISLVTALAALGGALTRQPLTAALNSFSAGVHGFVQGKQQVFQDNLKSFDANLKKASAENESQWRKYQAAKEKHGADIQGLQIELQQIAAETQNPIDIELARQGRIVDLMKLAETRNNNYTKALEQVGKLQEQERTHREQAAARAEAAADRRSMFEQSQAGKGWQVFQNADGSLVRVNATTGETQPIEGSKGLVKPKAGGSSSGSINTRNALVVGAANNAIDRMNELKQDGGGQFPTTSVMFGQHGDGVFSRSAHALGQSALSKEQQKIDAGYASLVDEAIPVFTGGLRGSDAFRRFLLGQVPQPGDSPETANEKMRLFEANIKGTLKTFQGAFSSNKAFHAESGGDNSLTDAEQAELEQLRAKHGRK